METNQEEIQKPLDAARAKLATVAESAAAYQAALQGAQERFEIEPMLDRVEGWLARWNSLFAAQEYGDSLVGVASLIEQFKEYTASVAVHQQILDGVSTEQEALTTRVASLSQQMEATAGSAEEYHTYLLLSQERMEKLPAISRVTEVSLANNKHGLVHTHAHACP